MFLEVVDDLVALVARFLAVGVDEERNRVLAAQIDHRPVTPLVEHLAVAVGSAGGVSHVRTAEGRQLLADVRAVWIVLRLIEREHPAYGDHTTALRTRWPRSH